MKNYLKAISATILLFLTSCSQTPSKSYTVAVDPAFYNIESLGREKAMLAFLNDLIFEISKKTGENFQIISTNWNTLVQGLEEKRYPAIISNIPIYNFTQSKFSFSPIILSTGPVLVIPEGSSMDSFEKLKGKEVGIISDSRSVLVVEKYPDILIRQYDSIPKMLSDVANFTIEAAVAAILPTLGFVNDLFMGQLQIASSPLTDEGLRLITLKDAQQEMLKDFDKALKDLIKDGTFNKLQKKWSLID